MSDSPLKQKIIGKRLDASRIATRMIPVEDIEDHPENYNGHPAQQLMQLSESHAEFGQYRSILVWARPGGKYIRVVGHGYSKGAEQGGEKVLRCEVLPEDTPAETIKAIMVADNLHAQNSEPDDEMLASLLQEQQDAGFDLASLGTDDEYLRQLLEGLGDEYLGNEGESEEDDFDEEETEEDLDNVEERCKLGDVWQLGKHRLYCGDSTQPKQVASLLQGNKADLIFADPPYGIDMDEWDKAIPDLPAFLQVLASHLNQGGFFAFTHQMPYMLDWLIALEKTSFKYKDHVVWVKRIVTGAALPLLRSHESLFIYSHGPAKYYKTEGTYTDVKLPGVHFDVVSIEGIDRYIKDLQAKIKGTASPKRGSKNHHSAYTYGEENTDRSPEIVNFTNVWSFLPEHQHQKNGMPGGHATVKPLLLIQRLIELCSSEDMLVYDPFLGSGTTLLAAEKTGRQCIGSELSPHHCDIALHRWEQLTNQQATLLERAGETAHA
jgi:DNA modification methylase